MKNLIEFIIDKFFKEIKKMQKDEKRLLIHLFVIYIFILGLIYIIHKQNQTIITYQKITTEHNLKLNNDLNEMQDDLNIIKIMLQVEDNKNLGVQLDKYFSERRNKQIKK